MFIHQNSPSSSTSCSSSPELNTNTLALLDSFLISKAEEEFRFNELAKGAAVELNFEEEETEKPRPMMSVDGFRAAFNRILAKWLMLLAGWYTTPFAMHLAHLLHMECSPSAKVAFVCCPTGFVAFQHIEPIDGTRLFEYDQRFSVLAPRQYVSYDLDEPEDFPEELENHFDIAVVDPPFLNEVTNQKLAQTLHQILHPTRGKLLLITSTSIESALHEIYSEAPIGPVRKTSLTVQHGQLQNDFACWGSWDGAETFGA